MESFKCIIIQSRLDDCGLGSRRKSLSVAQLRAALVEGNSAMCSSGKGGWKRVVTPSGPRGEVK